jgi:hypothetical protein
MSTLQAYWFGDAEAIGAKVFIDGKFVTTLHMARTLGHPLVSRSGLEPCYGEQDTIVRAGEPMVSQWLDMPRGEHVVEVVGVRGDSVSCVASIQDSPSFEVLMRCPALIYPSPAGGQTVAHSKG